MLRLLSLCPGLENPDRFPFFLQASPILNVMPYFLEYASGALKRKRVYDDALLQNNYLSAKIERIYVMCPRNRNKYAWQGNRNLIMNVFI